VVLTVGAHNAFDVIVVGGGNAGLLAAIAAREVGCFAYDVPSGSGLTHAVVCGRTAACLIKAGS